MNKYFYKNGGFYTPSIHNEATYADAVEITENYWIKLLSGQSAGKIISEDDEGYPILIDAKPLTDEQLKQQAESLMAGHRAKVDFDITPLNDAVDLEMATDAELARLKQLKQFRVTLNRWQYPEPIPTYPVPEPLEFV